MKTPRFYTTETLVINQVISLPSEIHRHAIQVLRLSIGEPLILFNGQGGEYLCQIQLVEKRKSSVLVQSLNNTSRESSVSITLVQSLVKPEKMDFCIQKSVELGVTAIQPLIADRTIVRIRDNQLAKKVKRWENIIIAACEQSGRTKVPVIHAPITLNSWLEKPSQAQRIMMLPEADKSLSQLTLKNNIELLVGPEGGFTDQEVRFCCKTIQTIQFGSRILRAETAAIAGLSLLQAYTGNL